MSLSTLVRGVDLPYWRPLNAIDVLTASRLKKTSFVTQINSFCHEYKNHYSHNALRKSTIRH